MLLNVRELCGGPSSSIRQNAQQNKETLSYWVSAYKQCLSTYHSLRKANGDRSSTPNDRYVEPIAQLNKHFFQSWFHLFYRNVVSAIWHPNEVVFTMINSMRAATMLYQFAFKVVPMNDKESASCPQLSHCRAI